jgi:hypothetical protein
MTKLDIFKTVMKKAKANGYKGPSADYELGRIVNGTNIYAIIFREDFAKALWGEKVYIHGLSGDEIEAWRHALVLLVKEKDKWKYLEENALD